MGVASAIGAGAGGGGGGDGHKNERTLSQTMPPKSWEEEGAVDASKPVKAAAIPKSLFLM